MSISCMFYDLDTTNYRYYICKQQQSYYTKLRNMKTFIITQIANNFRKRIAIAKYVQVKHLNYMYQYNYIKLTHSLIKSYFVWNNYLNQ